ncbi:MAG: hypothetical protein GXP22_01850 [Gammaproteobacteria bacterium]|nr:hypothetical protein [Gammaproteobacteria bacterium]
MHHSSLTETRREYIRVGSMPASMRARVSVREEQFLSLELIVLQCVGIYNV